MNETRIYADAFETTFANTKEMLEFLAERAKASQWIRKPTRMLRLVPLEKEAETIEKSLYKATGRNCRGYGEKYPVGIKDQWGSVSCPGLCYAHDLEKSRCQRHRFTEA